jgi:hypothetical protein
MDNKPLNRASLKELFAKGKRPSEENFSSLIDSLINKVDDGISKNMNDGLVLAPEGEDAKKLLSFYNNVQDEIPQWNTELLNGETQGLGISEPISETEKETRLFFKKGGNTGINTVNPQTDFDVNGILGSKSRIGTHILTTAPADGSWHDVVTGLNGCCAFEIMAQVGKEKKGKYALLHAHALSTFGKSHSKIKTNQAHYGWWWNKISLRWKGSTYDYSLQIRTRSNYGKDNLIKFHVTKLWDNDIADLFETKAPTGKSTTPKTNKTT